MTYLPGDLARPAGRCESRRAWQHADEEAHETDLPAHQPEPGQVVLSQRWWAASLLAAVWIGASSPAQLWAQNAAAPPPLAGEAPPPAPRASQGPKIVFEAPTTPSMLQANGDCRAYFKAHDWARAAICAAAGGPLSGPLRALALEQQGRHDEASKTWLKLARSAYGQENLEATRRANALARVEAAIARLVAGKARPAAKELGAARQTFERQARLKGELRWHVPGPALFAHALALRAARKKRPAAKTLSAMTRVPGGRAKHAASLQKARMKQRRERRGAWPLLERTLGGAGDDGINAMARLSGGDLLLAGRKQVAGADGAQLHVWRADSSGRMRWEQSFGAAGHDEAHAVVTLADGGWVAAGQTAGAGGQPDAWVVRFNANRGVRWHRTVGGGGDDRAVAALARTDGGVIVAVAADRGTNAADMGLLTISSGGQPGALERLGGAGEQVPAALVAHKSGWLMAGRSRTGKGPWQALLIALDGQQSPRWQHLTSAGAESTFDALMVARKEVVAIGRHKAKGKGTASLQLTGFDARGRKRWQKLDRKFADPVATAAVDLGQGKYALLATGRVAKRRANVWLLGFKSRGRMAWRAAIGAGPADQPKALLTSGRKGLLAAGVTNLGGAGGKDGWLVALRQ